VQEQEGVEELEQVELLRGRWLLRHGLSLRQQEESPKPPRLQSEDELRDELLFLHEKNEHLGKFLDNHNDILREAKTMRKEVTASLKDVRNHAAELKT
jgi:hypothetical protein